MTIQQLIDKLEQFPNKDLPVVVYDSYNGSELVPRYADKVELRRGTNVVIYSQDF